MSNYKRMLEKRIKDDEETAHAFKEFIDTFQASAPTGKTFIKSGVYNAGNVEESDDDKGKLYNPIPLTKTGVQETQKKAIECARLVKESKFRKCNVKAKSNLESLKEELRIRQLEQDIRHRQKNVVEPRAAEDGSSDTSTNLFLTNLSPKLKEQDLMQIFGTFGPLASVKIMWPRADDRIRSSNVGFVAFMSRKDSERAFEQLAHRDDFSIHWGKAVDIPMQPIYIPPEIVKIMLPPPYSGLPFNAQPMNKDYKTPETQKEMEELLYNSVVKVTIPLDRKIMTLIHRVIEFVVREGPLFEAMLMHKEINNRSMQFLFDNKSPTHVYYRWKLFSIMNGESCYNWATEPFRMFEGGSIWIPPTVPDYTKGMCNFTPIKNPMEYLSPNQQLRLIQIIQQMTCQRQTIADAMLFCLKHGEAAKDVVNIICDSFENRETIPTKKIARLYLISDILHNSKFKKNYLKNFPEIFEKRLVNIFEILQESHKSLIKTYDKDAFRYRVIKVHRAWETWKIFSNEFLEKLETAFLGESYDDSENDEPLDGKMLLTRSRNFNPDCILQTDVKVVTEIKDKENISDNFIQSKWETLDPSELESQAMSTQKLYELEMARLAEEKVQKERSTKDSLEHELLRKAEMKVIKYQDQLENEMRHLKKFKNIEEEVSLYRKKCIEKAKRQLQLLDTSPISNDSFSSDESEGRKKRKKKKSKKHRR